MSRAVELKFASYNIHKAVGTDGRRDPDRILSVLHELGADVVALQEVDRRFGRRTGRHRTRGQTPGQLVDHRDRRSQLVGIDTGAILQPVTDQRRGVAAHPQQPPAAGLGQMHQPGAAVVRIGDPGHQAVGLQSFDHGRGGGL